MSDSERSRDDHSNVRLNNLEMDHKLLEARVSQIESSRKEERLDQKSERSRIFWGLIGVVAMQVWNLVTGGPGGK